MFSRRTVIGAGLSAIGAAALPEIASCAAANRLSVLDFIPSREHDAIRSGHSLFDCSAPVQRAIDEAAAAGQTLFVPAGTYLFDPGGEFDSTAGRCLAALFMRSQMYIEAASGALFKIRDGVSSDRVPKLMSMFGTNEVLADISIIGLALDMNGDANPISPDRRHGQFSRLNQSHIMVSGARGGIAARIDGAHIARCEFLNTPGTGCIVMAQSNTAGIQLGHGWSLIDNRFRNNGLDTDDHSSVFGWADDVLASGNTFLSERASGHDIGAGGNTCYEVHGSRHVLRENRFSGYLLGIWVAPNYTTDVTGTRIENNEFRTRGTGVSFFKDRPMTDIRDTSISGNRFFFDDKKARGITFKACVEIASEFAQQDISVMGNRAEKTGTKIASAFGVVTGGFKGRDRTTGIVFSGNTGTGLTFGIFIRTTATAGLGAITAHDNQWINLTPAGIFSIAASANVEAGSPSQSVAKLAIGGGSVLDNRATPHNTYGVRINGGVRELDLSPTRFQGLKGPSYIEDGAGHVRSRRGTLKSATGQTTK